MKPAIDRTGLKVRFCKVPLMIVEVTGWDDDEEVWKGKMITPFEGNEESRYPEKLFEAIETHRPDDIVK